MTADNPFAPARAPNNMTLLNDGFWCVVASTHILRMARQSTRPISGLCSTPSTLRLRVVIRHPLFLPLSLSASIPGGAHSTFPGPELIQLSGRHNHHPLLFTPFRALRGTLTKSYQPCPWSLSRLKNYTICMYRFFLNIQKLCCNKFLSWVY